jgi:hypothetical protein
MKGMLRQSKRFLPPKPKGKGVPKELTHDQISQAIRSFQSKGGLIRRLPPQGKDARTLVGRSWDVAYESLFEHW